MSLPAKSCFMRSATGCWEGWMNHAIPVVLSAIGQSEELLNVFKEPVARRSRLRDL
jgi:hypothetical protein